MVNRMHVQDRFLEYVQIWTSSERNVEHLPSLLRQFDLAHLLVYQLQQIGLEQVAVDNHCFVYGLLPATAGLENRPHIGYIAHLDTHPDCPGKEIHPQIIRHYNGETVPLGSSGQTLSAQEFGHLAALKDATLLTSDGTTLLGVDDKAGIAEILTALECIVESGCPHGPVSVAFIPDEEIGCGTMAFDLARFGAEYAYTVDGWDDGEIVGENFNAVQAIIDITGVSTHTGKATGQLVNAQLLGMRIHQALPERETPFYTAEREGFYHLLQSQGTVDHAQLVYNVRDFSAKGLAERVARLRSAVDAINLQYGEGTAVLTIIEQYKNMKEKILPAWHLIENAERAAVRAGLVPKIGVARGGTDGARLSYMGLPCPNLGVGGYAYHSVKEHITVEAMEAVSRMLVELVALYADA